MNLAPEHTSSQRHIFLLWHQQQHLHSSLGTIKTTLKYQQINNFNFKKIFYLLINLFNKLKNLMDNLLKEMSTNFEFALQHNCNFHQFE
uniref:Uncharacterized protein n=1 Tax=Meloidogyne enterolobii TaxID=390850 RepID=A0A6V7XCL3_MELEN|nr:unnamed protein product [Meloidogyne enterolobii]